MALIDFHDMHLEEKEVQEDYEYDDLRYETKLSEYIKIKLKKLTRKT